MTHSGLPRLIANKSLLVEKIPRASANWNAIQRFALTFDGYAAWPDGMCAEIANARRTGTLTELRTCLFYEQRRWRHFGEVPDDEAMHYIRGIMEKIHEHVQLANELLR